MSSGLKLGPWVLLDQLGRGGRGIFLTALLPVLVLAQPVFEFAADWLFVEPLASKLAVAGCVTELRANETVHFTAAWGGEQPAAVRYTWSLDGEELGFGAWVDWQAPQDPEPRSYRLELKEEIDGAAAECVFTVRRHEG